MKDNKPRRNPGDRRDRRFDSRREPRAAAPAPVEEEDETRLEGRNAITEALRAGRTIDKIFIADGEILPVGPLTRSLSPTARSTAASSVWPPSARRPVPWSSPWTAGSWT